MNVLTALNASCQQNRPLLPANLKIYTRFSASQLGCHSVVQKQSWYSGAGAECDREEVPIDWAHSQMHVTQTRVQSHCSSLTENLTHEADPHHVFVLTSCAHMSLQ